MLSQAVRGIGLGNTIGCKLCMLDTSHSPKGSGFEETCTCISNWVAIYSAMQSAAHHKDGNWKSIAKQFHILSNFAVQDNYIENLSLMGLLYLWNKTI